MSDFADTAALKRPEIARLTAMVQPLVDEEIQREWARSVCPTRLEVDIDGQTLVARVDHAKGSAGKPFSAEDTRRKLEDCLYFGGFDPSLADMFDDTLERLPQSVDVGADFRKLSAAVAASVR